MANKTTYQVTVQVLVEGPETDYVRAAEKLVHGLAQELLPSCDPIVIVAEGGDTLRVVGASAVSTRVLPQDPGEELVYACPECGSCEVTEQVWHNPNTNQVTGETGSYSWCDGCDIELKSFVEIPRKETKEWKEQHAPVPGGSD